MTLPTLRDMLAQHWTNIRTAMQPPTYHVLGATEDAYGEMVKAVEDLSGRLYDLAYGQGHREGRDLGRQEGWAQRDEQAQVELRKQNAEIQALHAIVNAQRECHANELAAVQGLQEASEPPKDAPQPSTTDPDHAEPETILERNLRKLGAVYLSEFHDDITH